MSDCEKPFRQSHSWDRNFFLGMTALGWLGILMGFGKDIVDHVTKHRPAYLLIVHFHAVIFTGWLVLFTAQILLIRFKKLSVHKQLGLWMAGLAVVMMIIGPVTALEVQHHGMNKPGADPAFLSIQLTDILAFAGLVTAGLAFRKSPAAHKRLMLMGTLYITDAGFARWLAGVFLHWLGNGYWPTWVALYGPVNLLILSVGAYDLVTRRRLHAAFLLGSAWVFANQMTSLTLYFSPGWLVHAKQVIASWPF